MAYVKARYMPPGLTEPPGMAKGVEALDDQGAVWSLREDSEVGDWLRYIANGGVIDPEGTDWNEAVPVAAGLQAPLKPPPPPAVGSQNPGKPAVPLAEPNVLQDVTVQE